MKWIEIKDGCEMPNYDEQVLWLAEDGNCFVDALDKDGNPWLYEHESEGFKFPKVTHWTRFTLPDESRHPAEQGKTDIQISWELSQTIDKPFFIDIVRRLIRDYDDEEISLSKLVEELNLMAYKWAKSQPSGSEPTAGADKPKLPDVPYSHPDHKELMKQYEKDMHDYLFASQPVEGGQNQLWNEFDEFHKAEYFDTPSCTIEEFNKKRASKYFLIKKSK